MPCEGDAMTVELKRGIEWELSEGLQRITTIDAHTAGDPLRDGFILR